MHRSAARVTGSPLSQGDDAAAQFHPAAIRPRWYRVKVQPEPEARLVRRFFRDASLFVYDNETCESPAFAYS
jgi:hypothetical protein